MLPAGLFRPQALNHCCGQPRGFVATNVSWQALAFATAWPTIAIRIERWIIGHRKAFVRRAVCREGMCFVSWPHIVGIAGTIALLRRVRLLRPSGNIRRTTSFGVSRSVVIGRMMLALPMTGGIRALRQSDPRSLAEWQFRVTSFAFSQITLPILFRPSNTDANHTKHERSRD